MNSTSYPGNMNSTTNLGSLTTGQYLTLKNFGKCGKYGITPTPYSLILLSSFFYAVIQKLLHLIPSKIAVQPKYETATDYYNNNLSTTKEKIKVLGLTLHYYYQILSATAQFIGIFIAFDYGDQHWYNYEYLAYLFANSSAAMSMFIFGVDFLEKSTPYLDKVGWRTQLCKEYERTGRCNDKLCRKQNAHGADELRTKAQNIAETDNDILNNYYKSFEAVEKIPWRKAYPAPIGCIMYYLYWFIMFCFVICFFIMIFFFYVTFDVVGWVAYPWLVTVIVMPGFMLVSDGEFVGWPPADNCIARIRKIFWGSPMLRMMLIHFVISWVTQSCCNYTLLILLHNREVSPISGATYVGIIGEEYNSRTYEQYFDCEPEHLLLHALNVLNLF